MAGADTTHPPGGRGRGPGGPYSPPPRGEGLGERASETTSERASASPQVIVKVDPRYFRPTEVETLLGDASRARHKLGWRPRVSFQELVAEMVREDLKAAERGELVKRHGHRPYDYHE